MMIVANKDEHETMPGSGLDFFIFENKFLLIFTLQQSLKRSDEDDKLNSE